MLILCAQGGFEMPIGGQLCNPARITRIVRYPDHDDDDDDHFCYDSNVDKNDQLSNLVIRITRTVGLLYSKNNYCNNNAKGFC